MKVQIHSAPWVIPVTRPVIENGAVAVFERCVVDVGYLKDMMLKYPGHRLIHHPDAILMPSLVNAHCHLELSPLKWRLAPTGSIIAWVESLAKARASIGPEEWMPAIKDALDELVRGGALIVGDVGNTGLVPSVMMEWNSSTAYRQARDTMGWPLEGIHFVEIIAPEAPSSHDSLQAPPALSHQLEACPASSKRTGTWYDPALPIDIDESLLEAQYPMPVTVSAHGVHTVHAVLLKTIKARTRLKGLPFTLHVAESPEEIQYLKDGVGPMFDLLKQHGRDPARLKFPSKGPVAFLDDLGLLDEMTLLVHCVQLEEDELDIIESRGASICLCPRSNTFLGVGAPPVDQILNRRINCAIGTDSLASNDRLDIFSEMAVISTLSPNTPPSRIIEMATIEGARALGLANRFGSLEPHKTALFLGIRPPQLPKDPQVLEETIVGTGSRDGFEISVIR